MKGRKKYPEGKGRMSGKAGGTGKGMNTTERILTAEIDQRHQTFLRFGVVAFLPLLPTLGSIPRVSYLMGKYSVPQLFSCGLIDCVSTLSNF